MNDLVKNKIAIHDNEFASTGLAWFRQIVISSHDFSQVRSQFIFRLRTMNNMPGIFNNRRFVRAMILCAAACWGLTLLFWKIAPFVERDPKLLEGLTTKGAEYYWPEYDIPVYVVMCVFSLVATTITAYVTLRNDGFPEAEAPTLTTAKTSRVPYFDIVFIVFLFAVIWVPYTQHLIEETYLQDRFHHLNFYIMGPLQLYQQGAALGTEAFTQYQSGWVMLFTVLGKFTTIDHPFVIQVLSFFAAVYFSVWYFVLRKLGLNSIWAVVCILVCLMVQHFLVFQGKAYYTLWVFPSSTICRNPTDVFVLCSLLFLSETNKLRYAFLAGFFVGLGVLFGNDTGVYVAAAALGTCTLRLLDRQIERRQTFRECTVLVLTAVATALFGLAIASRGTLLQPAFWSGYYEAIRLYGSGFSAIPIRSFLSTELTELHWSIFFLCTLVIYTVAIARATILAFIGRASRLDPLFGFIGIIGFGTLILFINRSHPYNLTHVIVPAIVLWFVEFLRYFAGDSISALPKTSNNADRWGILLVTVCVLAMLTKNNARRHPSILNTWTGLYNGKMLSHEYLDDIQLLPQLKSEIEQRLGQQPYSLVGEDATLWQMAFNKKNPTRYLPMLLITHVQEEAMLQELEEENLIFCKQRLYHAEKETRQLIERKYSLVDSTKHYDIYRRKDLPPLTLQPVESDDGK